MPRNDLVLLDSLVEKTKAHYGQRDDSEYFELFCFDNILKDFEPSYEELESGWTDGGDDGGIDGLFVILDEIFLTEVPEEPFRRTPIIDLYVISAKQSPTFRQAPLNALLSSLPELLDLTKKIDDLSYPFSSDIIQQREIFRETYISLADRHPKLHINIVYATRGDTNNIAPNVSARAKLLKEELGKLFSDSAINVHFYGAKEILEIARKKKTYSLRLRFIEGNISRATTDYVALCLLKDYFHFVTDEEGHLRRYLFESNVRDYLGEVAINRDIAFTLESSETSLEMDFWWLNNGITLLANAATIAGKELSLDNVQIVNGLQTTETIYRYFRNKTDITDNRALLVKVIVTSDETIRDRIIKATNYQNMVDLASLRGTDKIQRDIEHYLGDHGWFYDRRKGFYKNQGRPADKIVSMAYIGSAVQAIALRRLSPGLRGKTRWLRNDESYKQVFNEAWDLELYLVCLELSKSIENALSRNKWKRGSRYVKRAMALAIGAVWVTRKLKQKKFNPNELCQLRSYFPTDQEVVSIWTELGHLRSGGKKQIKGLAGRVDQLCA